MIYADVHIRVRSGPYRGAYLVYERATTYEVLEEGVPEGGDQGHLECTEGSVGTESHLDEGNRQGTAEACVSDGQEKETGSLTDLELGPYEPYMVNCDRCGIEVSCAEAVAEEGDEWECFPCWERCNEKELRDRQDKKTPEQLPLV